MTALSALVAVLGNVVAIVALRGIPHAYKPGALAAWHAEVLAHPTAAAISAWAFTVGLVAMVPFAVGLLRVPAASPGALTFGAVLVAAGALLNAAGTLAPAVVAGPLGGESGGPGLLALSLALDALFNLLLGVGLVVIGLALGEASGWPLWLRGLAVVAGAVTIPVAGQLHSERLAKLLVVAGPLWLLWLCGAAWQLARRHSPL